MAGVILGALSLKRPFLSLSLSAEELKLDFLEELDF